MERNIKELVTFESGRRTVARKARRVGYGWCGRCLANVLKLFADQAADLRGTTEREIYREIETGRLHFEETSNGKVLICGGPMGRLSTDDNMSHLFATKA
ncbi:MAG TPA: hypothetical protein VNA17_03570 [Pyrinomonadaceae bacterium]|nr:hypothetical protein [Pyrinomonadaceae bacterium]